MAGMRYWLLPALLLLLPVLAWAQEEPVRVKGRIINEQGEAVEYVQVGLPKRHIGTISTVDGRFELSIPPDTLEFFHVSYQPAKVPVTGPAEDLVIVLRGQELPPAVFTGGNTKEKYLVRPGIQVSGTIDFSRADSGSKGVELGTLVHARKPFLIQHIQFTLRENQIPGCVAAIQVYRIEGNPETFVQVLHKPVYFCIGESATPQDFDIQPEEPILLEPGKYFVAFQIVASDADARREKVPHLYTMLYLRSSYVRYSAMGELTPFPFNIGMSVKGLEYQ